MGKGLLTKTWLMGFLLAVSLTGCGSDGGGSSSAGVSAASSSAATKGSVSTEAAAVPLGTAGNYAILAKTGVSTVPTSVVTGNVGVSPIARVGLTNWSETYDATDTYATSAQVVLGNVYASDNVGGTTKVDLTTAVSDMETAYTAAAAKTAGVGPFLNLGGGTVTDQTLTPGVYTWNTAVTIPTDLTLNGTATDVWVFQIAGTLDMAAAKNVILSGGALAKNVFWQVSGATNIGASTQFKGIILGKTAITFGNKATIDGRLLAQTAVVLNATTVTVP
ncbi:MAG: ice-binding family protein [Geobacteraceae bacterium]|nr:ice-binding family protein [Geobacteraceae bacterium]